MDKVTEGVEPRRARKVRPRALLSGAINIYILRCFGFLLLEEVRGPFLGTAGVLLFPFGKKEGKKTFLSYDKVTEGCRPEKETLWVEGVSGWKKTTMLLCVPTSRSWLFLGGLSLIFFFILRRQKKSIVSPHLFAKTWETFWLFFRTLRFPIGNSWQMVYVGSNQPVKFGSPLATKGLRKWFLGFFDFPFIVLYRVIYTKESHHTDQKFCFP
jgi:hypothetical protein